MEIEKDNFEDDNELSRLEEEEELVGGDEIVETEEEELLITEDEPVVAVPAVNAAPKPAAKPAKKAAKPTPKKKAKAKPKRNPKRNPKPKLKPIRKKRRRKQRRRKSGKSTHKGWIYCFPVKGLGHCSGLFFLEMVASSHWNQRGWGLLSIAHFRQARLWDKIERSVRVSEFTFPGDSMRFDYSYQHNDTRGFL